MKMKWTIVLVFALSIGAIIVNDFKKINRLREQKQELEHSRIALLEEMYGFPKVIPDERSAKEMAAIYKDIAMAYTNGNLLAMYKGIARLPRVHDQMTEQSAMKIMAPFIKALNESFLLIRHLRDFTSVEEFDRYVQVSLAAVRFYGETEVRRKNGDPFPAGVECLALGVLQKYCKKFHDEGRGDLEKAAERYLELWIARIESIDGLTRQCVWQAMRKNTIYNKVVFPGHEWTDDQGVLHIRQIVRGLIRSGYTPKWLDVDFPLPQKVNANDGE